MTRSGAPRRPAPPEVARLRGHVDAWRTTALDDLRRTDAEADAVEVLHGAFTALLGWIETLPDRCQDLGWWWGSDTLDTLALPLADVLMLGFEHRTGREAAEFVRALLRLQRRGWACLDGDGRVTIRSPGC
jgi:hypothetical protein